MNETYSPRCSADPEQVPSQCLVNTIYAGHSSADPEQVPLQCLVNFADPLYNDEVPYYDDIDELVVDDAEPPEDGDAFADAGVLADEDVLEYEFYPQQVVKVVSGAGVPGVCKSNQVDCQVRSCRSTTPERRAPHSSSGSRWKSYKQRDAAIAALSKLPQSQFIYSKNYDNLAAAFEGWPWSAGSLRRFTWLRARLHRRHAVLGAEL